MSLIDPGKKAPAFTLKDQHGTAHRLSDYAGKPVVLYFYPKDDTPGCTQETCDFEARLPALGKTKAAVLGVSILDEKSKAKFATKHGITFPLLADADHAVAEKYGGLGKDRRKEGIKKSPRLCVSAVSVFARRRRALGLRKERE